ncbi:type II toxin-antitoxin system YafO family toxin [Enterobacter bugandensis]|uniref:type II toxin-antitoxin system YafO family toxin n=1 Tax=Enterobacter bugandensis TaxID=881260 RepID=UPI0023B126F7|nr:type II toxin-antitoxin system YafO family toxin [Enterobacter bugandensis]MDE7590879.1 type II toxin-antitoxin system YafO family toxin [Enterobacter bugandensis]
MKASWNTESYEKFLAPTFRIKPDWERDLLHDFITLKSSTFGVIPAIFGKDGPYTEDRKGSNQRNKTSNSALVYTRHIRVQDVYSLLAIFPVNAHAFGRDPVIMTELARYAKASRL